MHRFGNGLPRISTPVSSNRRETVAGDYPAQPITSPELLQKIQSAVIFA
jgi:hypothetical protein